MPVAINYYTYARTHARTQHCILRVIRFSDYSWFFSIVPLVALRYAVVKLTDPYCRVRSTESALASLVLALIFYFVGR